MKNIKSNVTDKMKPCNFLKLFEPCVYVYKDTINNSDGLYLWDSWVAADVKEKFISICSSTSWNKKASDSNQDKVKMHEDKQPCLERWFLSDVL